MSLYGWLVVAWLASLLVAWATDETTNAGRRIRSFRSCSGCLVAMSTFTIVALGLLGMAIGLALPGPLDLLSAFVRGGFRLR